MLKPVRSEYELLGVKWGIYHEAERLMHAIEDFAFILSIDLRVTSYDVTLILGRDALWEISRGA